MIGNEEGQLDTELLVARCLAAISRKTQLEQRSMLTGMSNAHGHLYIRIPVKLLILHLHYCKLSHALHIVVCHFTVAYLLFHVGHCTINTVLILSYNAHLT
jgi:hypothetical protein